jgi:dihydrofolate synthase / folylpolyglutamate synthase
MYRADAAHPNRTLADKLEYLYSLRGGPTIDLTIRPAYYELLERLGNPHLHLPPVIHVAGTNGKGSVIAYLKAILEADGRSVHTYTSPHLIRFNERITLAGAHISDEALEELLGEVTAATGTLPLTFFEITTALAFLAFARTPADILLLETGMGGRLDSTNVVRTPLATIVTPIGLDHCEYLGNSLEEVAAEKAGIFKTGTPCIIAPQHDRVMRVLLNRATKLSCGFYAHDETWRIACGKDHMTFHGASGAHQLVHPGLMGPHQPFNAGTAIAALEVLEGWLPDDETINRGLRNVRWPGRMQKLDPACFDGAVPRDWEIWLDGGHNENAATVLAAQARQWQETDLKPLHLIMGMMRTKDPLAFAEKIYPFTQSLTALPIKNEELAWSPYEIKTRLVEKNLQCQTASSLTGALASLPGKKQPSRVLVTGSLYLAGQVLSLCEWPRPGIDKN